MMNIENINVWKIKNVLLVVQHELNVNIVDIWNVWQLEWNYPVEILLFFK